MPSSKKFILLTVLMALLIPAALLSGKETGPAAAEDREVVEAEIDASIDDVWHAFTTSDGLRTWVAPLVEIDFKIGGTLRANYNAQGALGDASTIENTILSFDPKRMLSMRVTKAPEGFPFANAIKDLWTVIYFEEISPDRTKLTQVGLGYTDTEESQQMRAFFVAANAYQLNVLKESFGQPVETMPNKQGAVMNNEPMVVGIGGIFFKSSDPEKARMWYQENLGLDTNEYGCLFLMRNMDRPEEVNALQWSPFNEDTDYFAPSEKEFMINYRVHDIETLVKTLRENGVTIVDEIEEYPDLGKFVHILDPEGNKIELWEQQVDTYSKLGSE